MSKITLSNVSDITQATSAQTTINNNSTTVQTAFDNTLSRDGTSPNQMSAALDMNSNQILNLPTPTTPNSPARLIDVVGNASITIPGTGTSGHVVPFLDGNNTWSGTNTFLPNSFPNSELSQVPALTLKGNNTSGTANVSDLTVSQVNSMLGNSSILGNNNTWTGSNTFQGTVSFPTYWLQHGQVRFENDGGAHSGVLYPFNGNGLWVYNPSTTAWQLDAIPAGSLTSGGIRFDITSCNVELNTGQALVSDTFYYVYYTRNVTGLSNAASINFSVNGYGINGVGSNTTPGPAIYIKNGDVTQTLIGVVYPLGGSIAGTGANQLCLSWFNRIQTRLTASVTGSTGSSTLAALGGTCNLVMVDDQSPHTGMMVNLSNSTGGSTLTLGVGLDGSLSSSGPQAQGYIDVASQALNLYASAGSFAGTGFHSATALGSTTAGLLTVTAGQLYVVYNS